MTATELLRRQGAMRARQGRGISKRRLDAIWRYCACQFCFVCRSRRCCIHREPEILALPADVLHGEADLNRCARLPQSRSRLGGTR